MALELQREGAALIGARYVWVSIYCYLVKLPCSCRGQGIPLIPCVFNERTLCNVSRLGGEGFAEVFCSQPGCLWDLWSVGLEVLLCRQSVPVGSPGRFVSWS